MPLHLLLSPSLVALFPNFLALIERVLDSIGFLGKRLILKRLASDDRAALRELQQNGRPTAKFDAIETYFSFEEKASNIILFHITFLISLYFDSVETTQDLLVVKGWPLIAIATIIVSLFAFSLRMMRGDDSAAGTQTFKWWGRWGWLQFAVITLAEGWQHLAGWGGA